MSPLDFLTLANRLASGPGEAERRSAISRAYYAAFHTATDFIESCGVKLPHSAAAHDKVAHCMQNCESNDLALAGIKLNSLRKTRNLADYQLADNQFTTTKAALPFLLIAGEILDAISKASAQPLETRRRIRAYARDIIALPVTGED
jgi:uncharacterized protein (UPF0332 family)